MNVLDKLGLEKSIIFVCALISFLVAFSSNSVSVALPTIARELVMSNIIQNWVPTIFLLVIAMFSIPFGKLCDNYGLKKSLKLGLVIFVFSSIGSSLAFNDITLLLFRAIQGIGSTLLNVSSFSWVVSNVDSKIRGKALGINIMAVYIGLSIAPVIAGLLTKQFGWQSIFYSVIPFSVLAFIIITYINQENVIIDNSSIDYKGSFIYIFGILLFVYGFSTINTFSGIISISIGVILLIIFAIFEFKTENPIFNIKLFNNYKFSFSSLASLISYIATFVITYVLNYHFQYIWAMDSQSAGLILITTPLVMALVSPFAGTISDKINPYILSSLGMTFVTIAIGILYFLNESTPLYLVISSMVLQGLGFGLFSSPNSNIIMGSVNPEDTSSASAILSAVRVIGQTISLGILTVVFSLFMGNVAISSAYYGLIMQSSHLICLISIFACIIAVISSLVGLKSSNETI